MKISIVTPLYNEEKHIKNVLDSLVPFKLPVIVINDGSTDKYLSEISDSKNKKVTILSHKINLGKGAAMKTGAEFAFEKGADAIIFMDSDGQHSANDLPKFIKVLKSSKTDVVFGSRNYNFSVPLIRFLGNKLASVVIAMMFNIYVSDVLCGFKSLTKNAYKKLRWNSSGYAVEAEITARVGKTKSRYVEVPIETLYHNKVKGVTILDAFGILGEMIMWKFTI